MALLKNASAAIVVASMALAMLHISLAHDSPQDFLNIHNQVRDKVGVQPLAWNHTIAAYALSYAKKRAADCNLEHSGGPYGENIANGSGGFTAEDAVNQWAEEKDFYNHLLNSCLEGWDCQEYTQVVWRNSTYLGCARVKCHNGLWFAVCNYDPPGNQVGERPY